MEGGLWNGDPTALSPGLLGEAPGSRAAGSKAKLACGEKMRRLEPGRAQTRVPGLADAGASGLGSVRLATGGFSRYLLTVPLPIASCPAAGGALLSSTPATWLTPESPDRQPGPHRNAGDSPVWETRGPKSHLPVTAQAGTWRRVPVMGVTPSGCGGVGFPSVTSEDPDLGLEPGLLVPRAPGNGVSVGDWPEWWTEQAAGPLGGASRAGASGTPHSAAGAGSQ